MVTELTPGHNASMKRIASALKKGQLTGSADHFADNRADIGPSNEELAAGIEKGNNVDFHEPENPAMAAQPKPAITSKQRYNRKIDQQLRQIRDCVNNQEWDTAGVHAAALVELFKVLQANPTRVAKLKQ